MFFGASRNRRRVDQQHDANSDLRLDTAEVTNSVCTTTDPVLRQHFMFTRVSEHTWDV